jgi:hypothetical protein
MKRAFVGALAGVFIWGAVHAQVPNTGSPGVPNSSGGGTTLTPGQLPGTATNDNASAGNVGQIVTANVPSGSAVSLVTTNAQVNVTSISLTAGDWDVHGDVCFTTTGSTATNLAAGVSATSATLPSPGVEAYAQLGVAFTAGVTQCFPLAPVRASLASTTSYFLVAFGAFTGTSPAAFGTITARRAR